MPGFLVMGNSLASIVMTTDAITHSSTTATFNDFGFSGSLSGRKGLVIGAVCNGGSGGTISGITVDGVPATQQVAVSGTDMDACIYTIPFISSNSGDIAVTWTVAASWTALAVWAVNGGLSLTAYDTASDTGTPVSLSANIDIPPNGFCVGVGGHGNTTACTWGGLTEQVDQIFGSSDRFTFADASGMSGQTNRAITLTAGSGEGSFVAASFR